MTLFRTFSALGAKGSFLVIVTLLTATLTAPQVQVWAFVVGTVAGIPSPKASFISPRLWTARTATGATALHASPESGQGEHERSNSSKVFEASANAKVEATDDSPAATDTVQEQQKMDYPAIILDPFPEAADPMYAVRGTIGQGDFVVAREGGPTAQELTNENLVRILERRSKVTDLEVNTLVWKCLGYRFDAVTEQWTPDEVFPKWKKRFPDPPDLIGMQRIYSKEVDGQNLKNNQHLVRSVPADFKQSLKEILKPLGFTGYKLSELTPNLTRRAQCSNWLLYYREELFGYTLEELKERRRIKKEQEEQERLERERSGEQEQWKPPVKEVF